MNNNNNNNNFGHLEFDHQGFEIQTHKRLKRMQFIRIKHSMRIAGVIPLLSNKTTIKQQLNGQKAMKN